MELTVVCFLWYGDRWNYDTDMGAEYVNRLYYAVERNLTLPHRFVCFTNHLYGLDSGIEVRPLSFRLSNKGCLPKLFMFLPEAKLEGQVLALDIDLVITGSLDDIASYRGPFCVRSKFVKSAANKADGDIVGFNMDSKVVRTMRFVLSRITSKTLEELTEGKERYFYRLMTHDGKCDRWQDLYPGQICSYKRHIRPLRLGDRFSDREFPRNVRIVSCHGRPRPHEIDEPWAKENWIGKEMVLAEVDNGQ